MFMAHIYSPQSYTINSLIWTIQMADNEQTIF